jgi:hypothetical protein
MNEQDPNQATAMAGLAPLRIDCGTRTATGGETRISLRHNIRCTIHFKNNNLLRFTINNSKIGIYYGV